MSEIHYLTGEEGKLVVTKDINRLDREKEMAHKQNRWRGISERLHFPEGTDFSAVKDKALRMNAKYILKTSVGSYYIKCFPSSNVSIDDLPTSGELWDQMRPYLTHENTRGRKSRVWIFDY